MTKQKKPSLRELARRLGCSHSTLSQEVHDGVLTAGVHIDGRGRVFVTDIDAAAAQWNGSRKNLRPVVVVDRDGYDWTAQGLLDSYDAHDLLARTLVRTALTGDLAGEVGRSTFIERVTAGLREELQICGADADGGYRYDAETLAYAERVLATLVSVVTETDDETHHNEETETP